MDEAPGVLVPVTTYAMFYYIFTALVFSFSPSIFSYCLFYLLAMGHIFLLLYILNTFLVDVSHSELCIVHS
jgi:hypothetical protein